MVIQIAIKIINVISCHQHRHIINVPQSSLLLPSVPGLLLPDPYFPFVLPLSPEDATKKHPSVIMLPFQIYFFLTYFYKIVSALSSHIILDLDTSHPITMNVWGLQKH